MSRANPSDAKGVLPTASDLRLPADKATAEPADRQHEERRKPSIPKERKYRQAKKDPQKVPKMRDEMNHRRTMDEQHVKDEQDTVHCDRYLEEWTHAGKLTAISRRAKLVLADGLEGRRAKMSELMALYVNSLLCRRC